MFWGFMACLALVVAWDWYRGRGKRAADVSDKKQIDYLEKLGFKRD
jgi:hypothetical protein